MTLVYSRKIDGPQTHAFVIGCGRFKHLDKAQARQSTVAGAREMVRSLIEHADDLVARLATVEVLLSDPDVKSGKDRLGVDPIPAEAAVKGFTGAVKAATSANAKAAGKAWKDRLKPGDVALFYISSHGVTDAEEMAIALFEDIETDGDERWEQSINVTNLAHGVMTKGVQAGWFFFDACQEFVPGVINLRSPPGGVKIIVSDVTQSPNLPPPVTLAAGLAGQLAWAPEGAEPPYFTQALVRGLKGACVSPLSGVGMVVTAADLTNGLPGVAEWLGFGVKPQPLVAGSHNPVLMKVRKPSIPVEVVTDPGPMLALLTQITVTGPFGPLPPPALAGGVLRFEMRPDWQPYDVRATVNGGAWTGTECYATPSAQRWVLKEAAP